MVYADRLESELMVIQAIQSYPCRTVQQALKKSKISVLDLTDKSQRIEITAFDNNHRDTLRLSFKAIAECLAENLNGLSTMVLYYKNPRCHKSVWVYEVHIKTQATLPAPKRIKAWGE